MTRYMVLATDLDEDPTGGVRAVGPVYSTMSADHLADELEAAGWQLAAEWRVRMLSWAESRVALRARAAARAAGRPQDGGGSDA
jgi:hypothetical protein